MVIYLALLLRPGGIHWGRLGLVPLLLRLGARGMMVHQRLPIGGAGLQVVGVLLVAGLHEDDLLRPAVADARLDAGNHKRYKV